jgi:hypothetical protein
LQKPKVVIEKEKEEQEKKSTRNPNETKDTKEIKTEEVAIDKSQYVIQGIVWGGTNPVAIISGEVVGKGDIILGAKVVEIQKEKVILSIGSQKFQIETKK